MQGTGEDIASVVIRMFTDQVDPARSEKGLAGSFFFAIEFIKLLMQCVKFHKSAFSRSIETNVAKKHALMDGTGFNKKNLSLLFVGMHQGHEMVTK